MSDKKQIDRLFQEKLKNFEATPSDAVWGKIHDSLHKNKRKRRVVPIWWQVAGIAALLALLFTIGNAVFNDSSGNTKTNTVVDTPLNSSDETNKGSENKTDSNNLILTKDDNNTEETNSNLVLEESSVLDSAEENQNKQTVSNSVLNEKSTLNSSNNSKSRGASNAITLNNEQENVSNVKSNETDNQLKESQKSISNKNNRRNALAENVEGQKNNNDTGDNLNKDKTTIDALIKETKSNVDKAVTDNIEAEELLKEEEKEEALKVDTSIEEAIAEANTEDEEEKEEKLNRWNISPNVAPVYFNTLGKGSSLGEQFVDNSKSSDVTMSYGVGGSYAINKKLKIRAGVNKVDLGYSTNNVISYKNIDSTSSARAQIGHVNLNDNAQGITFMSVQSLNRSSTPEIINASQKGSIDQQFGFIEVPVELEYTLINNKFGVNIIGGFSTFIVDKNEVYAIVEGDKILIGEADNINNLSYSANLGLGINYNVSEKIKVNVEPTFKYQINTFNDSSGNFQPYFIGVYTGISYKF